MAGQLQLEIATPERLVLNQPVESAQIPGKDGYMGILPGHAALLSELAAGTLSVTSGAQTQTFTVTGGYVEIRDNHVRVLVNTRVSSPVYDSVESHFLLFKIGEPSRQAEVQL